MAREKLTEEERKERKSACNRRLYEKKKDQIRIYQAKYRAENSALVAERKLRYRTENKEKIRIWDAKYRAENRREILEKKRIYRKNNKKKILSYVQKWQRQRASLAINGYALKLCETVANMAEQTNKEEVSMHW